MKLFLQRLFFLNVLLICTIACSSDDESPESIKITVTASDFTKTMDENPTNGQVIGQIEANTNEGDLSFTLSQQQNPAGALAVNATSGELTVADKTHFDFETNSIITAVVTVANERISQNITIEINVQDIFEENIYKGDMQLKSQQDVIDFGVNGYTQITGILTIGVYDGYTNIIDLTPLRALRAIDGDFDLVFNKELTTTAGLENLSRIGGGLRIAANTSLEKIEDLQNITTIPSHLIISNNLMLDNLEGINQISSIGDKVTISDNPKIPNLDWMSAVASIGQSLTIVDNSNMANIDGLLSLESLSGGFLTIHKNETLLNLDGLENLNATVRNLSVKENPSLLNIEGVHKISPYGQINVSDNDRLSNINGLQGVISVDYAVIQSNKVLVNLEGLNNLANVNIDMSIATNESLISLNGLNGLVNINSKLEIIQNRALRDYCDLRNFLTNGTFGFIGIAGNAYNPTTENIINGNCSI